MLSINLSLKSLACFCVKVILQLHSSGWAPGSHISEFLNIDNTVSVTLCKSVLLDIKYLLHFFSFNILELTFQLFLAQSFAVRKSDDSLLLFPL